VVAVPLNDRQEDDLPALAAAVNAKTRAVYLVSPHNPSGTVSEILVQEGDAGPRSEVAHAAAGIDTRADYDAFLARWRSHHPIHGPNHV